MKAPKGKLIVREPRYNVVTITNARTALTKVVWLKSMRQYGQVQARLRQVAQQGWRVVYL